MKLSKFYQRNAKAPSVLPHQSGGMTDALLLRWPEALAQSKAKFQGFQGA